MSTQTFVIPGRLMGLNEYTRENRTYWKRGNDSKRRGTDLVKSCALEAKLEPYTGPVEIGISWIEGRQRNGALRDVDNISFGAKFVLDGLRECGVIPDDNPRIVRNVYHYFKFNSANPHIEVTLMDYDENGRTVHYMPVTGLD